MKIRKKLSAYLRDKLGVTESKKSLQEKVDFLSAILSLNMPELIWPDESIDEEVENKLSREFGPLTFFKGIHRNDIMFQHHLYHSARSPVIAFISYYQVGIRTADRLFELCNDYALRVSDLLDFGSGYGRVSRFLPHYWPQETIHVSEVKKWALKFQKDKLGFKTVEHTESADSFPERDYDLILALSVFTHLPKESFQQWFHTLCNSLTDKGILVFSFNNLDNVEAKNDGSFYFTGQSEDSYFLVSDRLADQKKYGLTFISRTFLKELAAANGVVLDFKDHFFSGNQEIAVARLAR